MPLRRRRLALLAGVVLSAHLWFVGTVAPSRLGDGAADSRPVRIDVAFVRELAQAAPSPAAAVRAAPPRPRRAARAATPVAAASAASAAQAVLAAQADPVAVAPPLPDAASVPALAAEAPADAVTAAASVPAAAASVAAAAAAAAPAAPLADATPVPPAAAASSPGVDFDWPPSTRLSYRLTGNYRGPVEGQASVEWRRAGSRYQVFMDVSIGPSFAPLMSRRVSSEGEITPEGLRPRRFDEETKVVLREPRRQTIWLDADTVRLPDGRQLPRPPGVQDSASQFVQLTWLFTTQPQWLTPGRAVEFPLALPRRVEPWAYDVLAANTLQTPAGAVPVVHVKPRRDSKGGGELTAEFWVAPSLQYLPVRIVIRQDADNFIDMLLERLPEQAAEIPTKPRPETSR